MLSVTFHGAARTTTGSMHYVEANGLRLLLDCGLYQGHRKEAFEINRNIPVDPSDIDAVILSHAHIDHSGNIPTLFRRGFKGPVITTPATADLCGAMLRDSCYIQAQDLEFVNRKRAKQGKKLFEPLYEERDVRNAISHFQEEPLYRGIDLGNDVYVLFHEAGHILGSAIVELVAKNRKTKKYHKLVFTGDLGNKLQPILRPPAPVEGANTILIESTYADRDHPSMEDVLGRLKSYIEDIHQQKSKLIVPCFSVGRTQELIYFLNLLVEKRRIPPTKVFVDSPLALNATEIYDRHKECYDDVAADMLRRGDNVLNFPGLQFTHSVDDSKALNDMHEPMIILSASGMCEGGRIVHHLRNNITDPRNIVLIVGYQAENTLGRRIVEHQPTVKIFGEEIPLNARVHTINALSAHADRGGLMNWFDSSKGASASRVFAVHGDEAQTDAMVELLKQHGAKNAVAPVPGQKEILDD